MKANYKGSEVGVIRFNFASKMAEINLKGTDTTVPFSSLRDIKAEAGEPFYVPLGRQNGGKHYVWAQDKMNGPYYEIISIDMRFRTVKLQADQEKLPPIYPTHTPPRVTRPLKDVLFLSRKAEPSVKIEGATKFSSQYKLTRIVLAGYAVHFSGQQIIAKNSLPEKKGTLTLVYERIFGKRK